MNIREMRENLGRLDALLEEQGEIIITKGKVPIAKVVPVKPKKKEMPSNDALRASIPFQGVPSSVYIREDRDAR